jgi:hypothetical protein
LPVEIPPVIPITGMLLFQVGLIWTFS